MSLIVIIALDIFVVSMIFAGLHDHSALLTSPYEYMPSICREAIIEKKWVGEYKTDTIQQLILAPENSYRYGTRDRLDQSEISKTHSSCQQLLSSVRAVKEDKAIVTVFRDRKSAQQNKIKLTQSFKKSKAVYDTNLLENIADTGDDSQVSSIAAKSKELTGQINQLSKTIADYNATISANAAVKLFSAKLVELQGQKTIIVGDIKKFDFWYPIKELAWQFLFLLPLCGLFYLWNSKSIQKNSTLQVLISSHLLVVSCIPVLFKLLKLILDIIPHRVFESLFQLLVSLRIIAIWHYIIILLAILLALLAIYLIQKKLFSPEKIKEKRLMKGSCHSCGKKLPKQVDMCPFCGTNQQIQCIHCNGTTYIGGQYCVQCGALHSPHNEVS
ncbi:hypothetical protein LA52FAK_36630 [Desulforhopalus sp. 52FAK]